MVVIHGYVSFPEGIMISNCDICNIPNHHPHRHNHPHSHQHRRQNHNHNHNHDTNSHSYQFLVIMCSYIWYLLEHDCNLFLISVSNIGVELGPEMPIRCSNCPFGVPTNGWYPQVKVVSMLFNNLIFYKFGGPAWMRHCWSNFQKVYPIHNKFI